MGKKAKLKQIRRLAAQLPEIQTNVVLGERVLGEELHKSGIYEVEGKGVDLKSTYTKRKVVQQPINHNRRMKQLYNQHGAKGVGMYIGAVNEYTRQQQEAAPVE